MPTLEYHRAWRAAHREEQRAYYREYRRRHPEHREAYCQRNPAKVQARSILNEAVRQGKLARGDCEVCGATDAQAHHTDYSRPLDVQWLCPEHHHAVHTDDA